MSRQLSLFGKPVRINSYFRNPVSEYEKFINKHWNEKGHVYVTKKKFMEFANKQWKQSSKEQREHFMKIAMKPSSEKVTSFFKPISKSQPNPSCSDKKENQDSEKSNTKQPSSEPSKQPQVVADAFSALNNREKFLQCKEKLMISTLFSDLGLSEDTEFFTDDIVTDSEFLKALKGIALNYENFRTVYNEYLKQNQKERTSVLSHKLNEIRATGEKLVSLVKNCINASTLPISANALVLSEIYLKKAKIVKEILITGGTSNSLINDDFVKTSLKRRLKQQKNVPDQSFSINPSDYSFQFFCYNGVNLKRNDVFELLTDYQNEGVTTTPMSSKMLLQNAIMR